jgi:hypothetical protein
MAMILFSEGSNYHRIARILNKVLNREISHQLVIYWIQKIVDKMSENSDR